MVQSWQPGTQYNFGDEVEFEGIRYKIIQPHRSQAPTQPQQQQQDYGSEQRPWDKHDQTTVEFGEEEKQKNWYDIDPERRKQLEIGGGLLAGAALLGGGFLAYKKHKENEEEKKAQAWALQNWITDAQRRAQLFHRNGPSGPATWVLTHGKNIPQGAFQAGQENDGTPLYFGRTFFEGGIHPGKVSPNFQKGAIIGYDNDEIEVEQYEILIADPQRVRWAQASHPFNPQYLGATPVEGGREADGTPLYLVQAPYKDGTHPGKTSEKLQGADITYGGKEKIVNPYNVLVYA
ncbi:hypothetical protein RhiJN_24636 [Ceratobasidium sp. AG-Ba]|nr:hypothetical protein RhiJN_24636 [Ceratobasidium sp. AG-Ba]